MNFIYLRGPLRTAVVVVALASAGLGTPRASAETFGGGCQFTGSSAFSPGLTLTSSTKALRTSANLTLCNSVPAAPSGGTVSIGHVWTDPATGFQWQEPIGSITGSCATTDGTGDAITRWSDGTVTVVDISLRSGVSQVVLSGVAVNSVELAAVEPRGEGQPDTLTLATSRFAGGSLLGYLNVTGPTTALVSCGGAGLNSVTLSGGVSLSSPS